MGLRESDGLDYKEVFTDSEFNIIHFYIYNHMGYRKIILGGFRDGSGTRRGVWVPRDRYKMETEVTFLKGGVRYKVTRDEPSPSDADVNSLADNALTRCRH